MSYAAAVHHLYALGQELASAALDAPRRKFDLEHMRVLARGLGDPQRNFRSILIAGTNGKGSTAATLARILAVSGYRTALYTSPHLQRVNERIQVSAADAPSKYSSTDAPVSAGSGHLHEIEDDDFARIYFHVNTVANELVTLGSLPHAPSFFEVLTGVAFVYFAEQRVNTAVLEVGLGGRLDATNIVDPLLSIITDIALDHQEYLGSTLAEITREKAGILRPHGVLITLPQHPEANQTIGEVATATAGLRAISAADYIPSPNQQLPQAGGSGERFGSNNHYQLMVGGAPLLVDSPLAGSHQRRNVALAIAAAVELRSTYGYILLNEQIAEGIRRTQWPGRLERLPPNLLLDVAHNPAGAWTLRSAIAGLPDAQPRTLLFSCLRDKNLREMAQILFPLFDSSTLERRQDHIVLAPIDNPRAAAVGDLLEAARSLQIPAHAAPHVAGALSQARQLTPKDGIIIATGSVYLVGEVRQLAMETE